MAYELLINGRLVAGDMEMEVVNPASEEVIARCARASREQLEEAVASAKAAFPAWAAAPVERRKSVLLAIADAVDANAEELARLLALEGGKPLPLAHAEVGALSAFTRYFASLNLAASTIETGEGRRADLQRRPLGVVGAIIPWNFPLMIVGFKLPPALLAGNTLVLKPAPTTPLATLRLAEIIASLAPPGVVNVIADENDLGDAMTSQPDIAKISFTGSAATGRKIMSSASATLKRLTLELGGNDAAIVLGDVDVKTVAPKLFEAAFVNSGQVCLAIKRLYVHESIYEDMCGELVRLANESVVGDPLEQGVTIGPLQNKAQFLRVLSLIEDAARTATVACGGARVGEKGYFIKPTIVRDIAEGSRLVDEEQFGPVLPVMKYSTPEEALARANASPYGLGGSIWSSDEDRAYALACKLEAGTVWINTHMAMTPNVPFGGCKQSGFGVEFGEEGLAEFTQLTVVNRAA
jgi:acyl-CoA reductase-like NAD-dependent aldehyde dehydrogenase